MHEQHCSPGDTPPISGDGPRSASAPTSANGVAASDCAYAHATRIDVPPAAAACGRCGSRRLAGVVEVMPFRPVGLRHVHLLAAVDGDGRAVALLLPRWPTAIDVAAALQRFVAPGSHVVLGAAVGRRVVRRGAEAAGFRQRGGSGPCAHPRACADPLVAALPWHPTRA